MSPQTRPHTGLLTAEEYGALLEDGRRTELVRGKVIELPRPKPLHGKVCMEIARLLGNHLHDHDVGHGLANDAGFVMERDPDTVRGPDVAFFSYDRLPPDADLTEYPLVAPEVAFEVLSPGDRPGRLEDKVDRMLAAGVHVVVLVDPRTHTATLVTPDARRTLAPTDTLELPEHLPGWQTPVADLFPRPRPPSVP